MEILDTVILILILISFVYNRVKPVKILYSKKKLIRAVEETTVNSSLCEDEIIKLIVIAGEISSYGIKPNEVLNNVADDLFKNGRNSKFVPLREV